MKELSSCGWSGIAIWDVWEVSFGTLIDNLEISGFWTISDWTGLERTEFGLVRPSLISFDVSCHEFYTGFHFAAWHVYGFHPRETTVICFAVMWRVVHGLTVWIWVEFACLPRSALFSFCLRHWNLIDYTLPVKMCGTHLGVIRSVIFVGSVNHLLRCASHTLGWEEEVSLCFPWNGWFVAWNALLVHVGL